MFLLTRIFVCLFVTAVAFATNIPASLPLHFEPNVGQLSQRDIVFFSRGSQSLLLLDRSGAVSLMSGANERITIRPLRANTNAAAVGVDELPGTVNYLTGNNPQAWRTKISVYRKVQFASLYRGVDFVVYANAGQFEYDLTIEPGASAGVIGFAVEPAKRLRITPTGDLVVRTDFGELRQRRPVAYQQIGDRKVPVQVRFAITGTREFGFRVGHYDRSRPLVIDPAIVFSTYLGGSSSDEIFAIATDAGGSVYLAGYSQNLSDFPSARPLQSNFPWDSALVAKVNAIGTELVFATYFGGGFYDRAEGIVVDSGGNIYVTGTTDSRDFPLARPFQGSCALQGGLYCRDAFIAKLSPDGSTFLYSTYLGGAGTDEARAIAVDAGGTAWVTGRTDAADFPIANAIQPQLGGGSLPDAFLVRLSADGSTLFFSTYLGGAQADEALGIAVDREGNAYIAGKTWSTDLPTANPLQGALHATTTNDGDASVAKFAPEGRLVYSTYLGGRADDAARGIAVDSAGRASVAGITRSSDFPVTASAFQPSLRGREDAFVARLTARGDALVYSTYLGGATGPCCIDDSGEGATAIAVDLAGHSYVTGMTVAGDFPVRNAFQIGWSGSPAPFSYALAASFITRFDPTGGVMFSTYLGRSAAKAIALDATGNIYVAGSTSDDSFFTLNAIQSTLRTPDPRLGFADGFLTKISPAENGCLPVFVPDNRPLPQGSGVGSVQVRAPAGCPWMVENQSDWLSITGARTGVGDGLVTFAVGPNYSVSIRHARFAIGREYRFVSQEGCSFNFSAEHVIESTAASIPVTIQAPAGCVWSAAISTTAWLSGSASGSGDGRLVLQVAANPDPAPRIGEILLALADHGSRITVFQAGTAAPVVNTAGIVNGAHFGSQIAPGAIISLFGQNLAVRRRFVYNLPLPTALDLTRVKINGIDVPLFYLSDQQINAQIPFNIPTGTTVPVELVRGSARWTGTVRIEEFAPALFTLTSDGRGLVAALYGGTNAVVQTRSPVARGSTVSLFATGLGAVTPPVRAGEPAPDSLSRTTTTPTVLLGDVEAPVLFSGLAPGFAGLYQINVTIPQNAPVGDNVPVSIRIGEVVSQAIVTIPIR